MQVPFTLLCQGAVWFIEIKLRAVLTLTLALILTINYRLPRPLPLFISRPRRESPEDPVSLPTRSDFYATDSKVILVHWQPMQFDKAIVISSRFVSDLRVLNSS